MPLSIFVSVQEVVLDSETRYAFPQDNREAAERMLTHGEQLLQEWKHPEPIIREYDGSMSIQHEK